MLYKTRSILIYLLFFVLVVTVSAQDEMTIPTITVSDQIVSKGSVIIDQIESPSFGFVVIRNADWWGEPGGVIGLELIHAGLTRNLEVELEMINITPTLYATIHFDTEPYGNFQYGEVDDADPQMTANNRAVSDTFTVAVMSIHDQFVDPDNFNRIVIDTASARQNTWLVAHADNEGEIGEVLGQTYLWGGTSQNLPLLLSGDVTDTVHIVMHDDTGDRERFDFGEAENADMPMLINDAIAMTSISTVPTLRVDDQLVIGSDLTRNENEFAPFVVDSVLSDGVGWLVVHVDDGTGQAGDVIGFAPVQNGFNDNVIVELPQAEITPRLFPMLHEDTGEALVYEFTDGEALDLPATYNEEIIMGSATVIPSINDNMTLMDNLLIVENAVMDTAGWLVIYADNGEGDTGDVIGYAPLNSGLNRNIKAEIEINQLTETLFLMLHYDTSPVGVFTFTQDDGNDLPVIFEGETVMNEAKMSN